MKFINVAVFILICWVTTISAQTEEVFDDFEGTGTITNWFGDACNIDTAFPNLHIDAFNGSSTVLAYHDVGGQYANVRFQIDKFFDLRTENNFSLKIYVPSSDITGNAPNQVSLKLQNGNSPTPWTTQCEIIKPISLDTWQTVEFDFGSDSYINFDPTSANPTERTDFNRIVIQVNGENNNHEVLAFLDDVRYSGTIEADPVYDRLIWSDEFDEDGALDDEKWFAQTIIPQGNSWFNGEIQHYTDRTENIIVEDGVLKIIARKEQFSDQGITKNHTSARLNSKYAFQYGRVEIRAKLPSGPGTWPALWMLGKNITENGAYWEQEGYGTTSWPQCGEIDIMEHWGSNQNYVSSATHTPSSFGGTVNHGGQYIETVSTDFHDYELLWTPEELVFSVDGNIHFTYDPDDKNLDTWPFDAEMYFLFNIAILPDISPNFQQSTMEIDYIRVYGEGEPTATKNIKPSFIKTYPNPVVDQLHMESNDWKNEACRIQIFSMAGELISSEVSTISSNQLTINGFNQLTPGIYIIQVEQVDGRWVTRVSK